MTIRKAYVDCSGGQLHYRYCEGTGTPIVFLQQTASSSKMYIKVMARLAGRCPLIAFDTPGFGGSFDPTEWPTMAQYADWLFEGMQALGLNRFHIFGHHTGSCIAVELGVRQASHVASLMMVGPVPLTEEERNEFSQHFGAPISPTADGSYLQATWDYLQGLGAHGDLALHHRELIDTTRAYMGRAMAYSAVWKQDWTSLYKRVTCPMLLLCAPDDVLYPFFTRAQEIRPDAKAVILKGANFEPDLDCDGTVAAIQSFLG